MCFLRISTAHCRRDELNYSIQKGNRLTMLVDWSSNKYWADRYTKLPNLYGRLFGIQRAWLWVPNMHLYFGLQHPLHRHFIRESGRPRWISTKARGRSLQIRSHRYGDGNLGMESWVWSPFVSFEAASFNCRAQSWKSKIYQHLAGSRARLKSLKLVIT